MLAPLPGPLKYLYCFFLSAILFRVQLMILFLWSHLSDWLVTLDKCLAYRWAHCQFSDYKVLWLRFCGYKRSLNHQPSTIEVVTFDDNQLIKSILLFAPWLLYFLLNPIEEVIVCTVYAMAGLAIMGTFIFVTTA